MEHASVMRKDINNINFKGLIGYIVSNYGNNGVKLLTAGLVNNSDYLIADKYNPLMITPVEERHLLDSAYWVSNDFSLKLLANVKKVVSGDNPLYMAGENTVMYHWSKSFLFKARVFGFKFMARQAARQNARFNRTKDVILVELTDKWAVFELHYRPGYQVTKDVCNWNLGIYSGLARLTGVQGVKSEELSCITGGAECCVFKVSWEKAGMKNRLLSRVMNFFARELVEDYEYTTRERDKLLDSLKKSEERYRSLTDNSLTGIFITQKGHLTYANNRFMQILGYSPEDLEGKEIWSFLLPKYQDAIKDMIIGVSGDKEKKNHFEVCALRKGGELTCLEVLSAGIEYNGQHAFMGNVIDITERKRAEEQLRVSEMRFSKIFNASPGAMGVFATKDGRCVEVNDRFIKRSGFSRSEIVGSAIAELNVWDDPEDFSRLRQLILDKGAFHNIEVNFLSKSGEALVALVSAELIDFYGEQCVLAVMVDATELKQMEKEIARLDRLNLVGQMAAGIGHEIRNPMTTVRGFLQMLGQKKEYGRDAKYFNLMIEELDRANSIITEFLSIARNRPENLESKNINSILESLSPLISADVLNSGKNVTIELGELPPLLLNEKEIRQLILNLVRNGLESMESGGNLTIRTYMEGDVVVFSVQDEGKGIEADIIDKIGTPFFTTKENGTGLGLAVCHGIATRHNAAIDVKTGPVGTVFYVRFQKVQRQKNDGTEITSSL